MHAHLQGLKTRRVNMDRFSLPLILLLVVIGVQPWATAASASTSSCSVVQTGLEGRELAKLLDAAVAGSPEVQFELGCMHELGINVPKDLVEAYAWYNAAAARLARAQEARDRMDKELSPEELLRGQQLTSDLLAPRPRGWSSICHFVPDLPECEY